MEITTTVVIMSAVLSSVSQNVSWGISSYDERRERANRNVTLSSARGGRGGTPPADCRRQLVVPLNEPPRGTTLAGAEYVPGDADAHLMKRT